MPHLAFAATAYTKHFATIQQNAIAQAKQMFEYITAAAPILGAAAYGWASLVHSFQVEEQDQQKWRIYRKRILTAAGGVFAGGALLTVVTSIFK